MPPIAIGIAAAVGTVGQIGAGIAAGNKEKAAARKKARAAEPTAEELGALRRSISIQQEEIKRTDEVLKAVDPAIIEAAKQARSLLSGKEAQVLAPIRRARERQKDALRSRLRQQLGPDFETSSAGIEALSRFEEESISLESNAQLQATQALLGATLEGRRQTEVTRAQVRGEGLQTAELFGRIQERRVATAGGEELAEASKLRSIGDAFGGLAQGAAAFGTARSGGLFGGGGSTGSSSILTGGGLESPGVDFNPGRFEDLA